MKHLDFQVTVGCRCGDLPRRLQRRVESYDVKALTRQPKGVATLPATNIEHRTPPIQAIRETNQRALGLAAEKPVYSRICLVEAFPHGRILLQRSLQICEGGELSRLESVFWGEHDAGG